MKGDKGGGLEVGGYNAASLFEFYVAIVKELLGHSFARTTGKKSLGGGKYSIETETQVLDILLPDRSSKISIVSAFLYNIADGS